MTNFNKTQIDGDYMIEPRVLGYEKEDKYAIK